MIATYILLCGDVSYYVGSTWDLDARVAQHVAGTAESFTATRRPVQLVWYHEFDRVDDAWALERRLHGWSRAKKRALIDGRFADLPGLSRSRSGGGGP